MKLNIKIKMNGAQMSGAISHRDYGIVVARQRYNATCVESKKRYKRHSKHREVYSL